MVNCPHCKKELTPEQVGSLLGSITSKAKKASSADNGKFGGKPRSKNPSKAALYQRQYRERSKKNTDKKILAHISHNDSA